MAIMPVMVPPDVVRVRPFWEAAVMCGSTHAVAYTRLLPVTGDRSPLPLTASTAVVPVIVALFSCGADDDIAAPVLLYIPAISSTVFPDVTGLVKLSVPALPRVAVCTTLTDDAP